MQLNRWFRRGLYGAFWLMFLTGIIWLVADWQKRTPDGDMWQSLAAWLLMVHGGGAMLTLLLLGALLPVHAYRSWRTKRNRVSGAMMVTLNSLLIATSFGLYYVGSEVIRPWMSDIHIAAGISLPVLLFVHIVLGRRTASALGQR